MKSVKRLLQDTGEELTAGKKLLVEKKRLAKRAKGKIARSNAKRQVQVIDEAVDSITDHRKLLAEQLLDETTEKTEKADKAEKSEQKAKSEKKEKPRR